jgi:hypothetical protein
MYAMLTVESRAATREQWQLFAAAMAQLKWHVVPTIHATFWRSFENEDSGIIQIAKKHVAAAARTASMKSWESMVLVGPDKPAIFR